MKQKFVVSVFAVFGLAALVGCGGLGVQDTVGLDDEDLLTTSDSFRRVSPSNIGPNSLPGGVWFFGGYGNENVNATSGYGCGYGTFVEGPATPPVGTGSVELNSFYCAPAPKPLYVMGGTEIYTHQFGGTRLADIRVLRYSTYVHQAAYADVQATVQPSTVAPSLQMGYSRNFSDVRSAYFSSEGRLIFEPHLSVSGQAVLVGRWQTWNALPGKWWATGPLGSSCPQYSPCTLQQVLVAAPNLTIGALAINLSSLMYKETAVSKLIYESYKANADRLVIRRKGETVNTIFNFERSCGSDNCPTPNPSRN